jgi:hypothetical protein
VRECALTSSKTGSVDKCRLSLDGSLFFFHPLPSSSVSSVQIFDLGEKQVTSGFVVRNGRVYHSLPAGPYWLVYYERLVERRRMLQYMPAVSRRSQPGTDRFSFAPNGMLQFLDDRPYWLRFTETNGYQVLTPYSSPPNDPWYPRIRFNLRPVPSEWCSWSRSFWFSTRSRAALRHHSSRASAHLTTCF